MIVMTQRAEPGLEGFLGQGLGKVGGCGVLLGRRPEVPAGEGKSLHPGTPLFPSGESQSQASPEFV